MTRTAALIALASLFAPVIAANASTESAASQPAPLSSPTAATAPAASARFALIIGSNQSPKPELPALRHADDDAAKYYELFAQLGEARLLTVLDDASQASFGGLADRSLVPSRANLQTALDQLLAGVAAARQQGSKTAFYFIYSGHGDVGPGMQGLLYLGSEKFSRRDLYQQVIARSTADYNHVVIDACNAYFMVERRGDYRPDEAGADHGGLVQDLLAAEDLRNHPNTGVMLSTSDEADSHEWSRFGSGLFSHEVRSGLLGGADLDQDGSVGYDELAAYLAAANSKVDNPKAKIHYYAAAPAKNRREPLL
ncbi:MAG: caspase family protein, partial [Deltaproteobacteria bacterium]|nr:caspase family protein [Deltaproteobacteria bacterium]